MAARKFRRRRPVDNGEFLWLTSLSDLMILLFIFFVVLFSFTHNKLKQADIQRIVATFRNQPQPPNPMDEIKKKLSTWVVEQKLTDQIDVLKADDAVLVEIKDKVFFSSGEYELSVEGKQRIRSLSGTLSKIPDPYQIGIEGHTDDVPIHNSEIRDNWELSSKRALSVFYALELPETMLQRTSVIAHGDTKPIAANRSPNGEPIPENQSKNRRVTFRIF